VFTLKGCSHPRITEFSKSDFYVSQNVIIDKKNKKAARENVQRIHQMVFVMERNLGFGVKIV
jgi:hypothetical protein